MSDLPPDARQRLAILEWVRLEALRADPPDCMFAFEMLEEQVRLLRAHGILKPPKLTPEQEAQLRNELEIGIAEAEVVERRFYGWRES